MSEYIITCDEETALWIGNDVDYMRPIVRCRDCKWYDVFSSLCMRDMPFPNLCVFSVTPDGFCAWGERADKQTVEVWQPASSEDVTCHE